MAPHVSVVDLVREQAHDQLRVARICGIVALVDPRQPTDYGKEPEHYCPKVIIFAITFLIIWDKEILMCNMGSSLDHRTHFGYENVSKAIAP
ncbi:hypothetical protein N7466_009196 [Penicillium verhagenii]|uniref:uncharacterized protein n=1 Tax=Penicillium verhagenii TaxID=1562060 RepID=UPI002545135C|nr:uncharacterized protein N7466_009196 [Penicillium verhagenii]KAJ5920870.1 hypothetical protein N7466_009196 [Penicillium verhagenii]